MTRSKWMILLKESFIPFLFLLVTLIIGLLVLDNHIEHKDDITLISLNREQDIQDEPLVITQKLQLNNIAANDKKLFTEINTLMDNQAWSSAIKKIGQMDSQSLQRNLDVNLTLAYLYYKTGNFQAGLGLLKSINPENNPRYYYNMGLLLGEQPGFYDEAIRNFEKFMTYKNLSYEALMNIGNLHFKKRRYAESLKFFQKSADVSQLARKAKALYMAGETSEKLNRNDEAIKYMTTALKHDPELVSARVRLAKLGMTKNPEKSISELEKLADIYPEYADTYQIIANYYAEKNENNKALRWMRKGIQQSPNSRQIKSNLGSIYLKMEEFEKAKMIFQELSGQFPREELYHFNLARAFFGMDDFNNAISEYNKALEIRPIYNEVFINLGIIYSKSENAERAIYYYKKAIAIESTDPTVYFNIGLLYAKQNRIPEALDAYQKAIELKKEYPEAYYNMASVYSRMKDVKNTEKSYLSALKFNPKYSNAYFNLALLYDKQKNYTRSIETLKQGIQETDSTKLKNKLGYEYKQTLDYSNALSTFLDVLKDDPENESSLLGAAGVYADLKNFGESAKYIEQYLLINPKNPEARYVYLVDLFNLQSYDEAGRQFEILNRISPDFRDAKEYKAKIALKTKLPRDSKT